MYYRADRLDRILALGAVEPLALPGRTYKVAFTGNLIREVFRRDEPFEELIPDLDCVLRGEAKYLELTGKGRWWIPSGKIFFTPHESEPEEELEEARRHFFLPRRFVDPFNNATNVAYDRNDLIPVEVRDAVSNIAKSEIDYRVLAPFHLTDANRNRSQISFDALGMVVGTAVWARTRRTRATLSTVLSRISMMPLSSSIWLIRSSPARHLETRINAAGVRSFRVCPDT